MLTKQLNERLNEVFEFTENPYYNLRNGETLKWIKVKRTYGASSNFLQKLWDLVPS